MPTPSPSDVQRDMPASARNRRMPSSGAPSSLRIVLGFIYIAFPTVGVTLIIVGIIGDNRHWWDDYAYLTNMLAGITTATLGVPLALAVFQRVSQARDNEDTREAATTFLSDALTVLSSQCESALSLSGNRETLSRLVSTSRDASIKLQNSHSRISDSRAFSSTDVEYYLSSVASAHNELESLLRDLDRSEHAWTLVENSWALIASFTNTHHLTQHPRWDETVAAYILRRYLKEETHRRLLQAISATEKIAREARVNLVQLRSSEQEFRRILLSANAADSLESLRLSIQALNELAGRGSLVLGAITRIQGERETENCDRGRISG